MNFKKVLLKLLTFYIPYKPWRKSVRNVFKKKLQYMEYVKQNKKYKKKLSNLRKIVEKEKIKVLFCIVYDAAFPARPIFEKMIGDNLFDPMLVVIPDIVRGRQNMLEQLYKTFKTYQDIYGNELVLKGYEESKDEYLDLTDNYHLVCSANPYDEMTHQFFTYNYFISKGLFPFFVNYAYLGRTKHEFIILNLDSLNRSWLIFTESYPVQKIMKEIMPNKAINTLVTGYCKMDPMHKIEKSKDGKIRIIIAPHHTVTLEKEGLKLSNFLLYADFFLELPKKYPSIDFIFRPHPLLFVTLAQDDLWGRGKVDNYLNELLANKNIIYYTEGDYFDIFVNSSALIHDSGSFLAEYFYTENPQCYLLRDESAIDEEFLTFGKEMLKHTYQAYNENQLIDFIDNVVISKNDYMKQSRLDFANENIKYNYPNASQTAIDFLKKKLYEKI